MLRVCECEGDRAGVLCGVRACDSGYLAWAPGAAPLATHTSPHTRCTGDKPASHGTGGPPGAPLGAWAQLPECPHPGKRPAHTWSVTRIVIGASSTLLSSSKYFPASFGRECLEETSAREGFVHVSQNDSDVGPSESIEVHEPHGGREPGARLARAGARCSVLGARPGPRHDPACPGHPLPDPTPRSPRQELELHREGRLGLDVAHLWQQLHVAPELLAHLKLQAQGHF